MDDRTTPHTGPIIAIGGSEDKEGDRLILSAMAKLLAGKRLVLATVASREPDGYGDTYRAAFADLGVTDIVELYVHDRSEAQDEAKLALVDGAGGVFFSGGDQLRITSQLGDTPVEARIRQLWESGGMLAGTSAGASAMSDTMLISGSGGESYRPGAIDMAPGLGMLHDIVIDQHFVQRGRFGRLLGAVARNPRVLGTGIDEDTAIIARGGRFEVIGSGAVYVIDGSGITESSANGGSSRPLTVHDVTVHVLAHGDAFDLATRRPMKGAVP